MRIFSPKPFLLAIVLVSGLYGRADVSEVVWCVAPIAADSWKGDLKVSDMKDGKTPFVRFAGSVRDKKDLKWPSAVFKLPSAAEVPEALIAKVRYRVSGRFDVGAYLQLLDREGPRKLKKQTTGFEPFVDPARKASVPVGEWIDYEIPLRTSRKTATEVLVIVNVQGNGVPYDFTFDLAKLEIVSRTDPKLAALRAEWKSFRENFEPDYTDGAKHLLPTEGHRFKKPFAVVKDGKPACRIVYAGLNWWNEKRSTPVTVKACEELQRIVKAMTGVTLPIDRYENDPKLAGLPAICVGKGNFRKNPKREHPELVPALTELRGTDGYAIREADGDLYVYGVKEKGAMNGVYALIENNTDYIFTRPSPQHGEVFTPRKDLEFVWGDGVVAKPKATIRGLWNIRESAYWAANFATTCPAPWGDELKPYTRGGHNINAFLGDFKEHNEFYGMVGGKRDKPYGNMVCFMNPKLKDFFAENVLRLFDQVQAPEMRGVCITLDDSYNWCGCPLCAKDFTLPTGELVKQTDPDFMSTQAFLLLNHAADRLNAAYFDKHIWSLAYFQTAEPPRCAVSPNLDMMFAPYYRANDTNPVFCEENLVWLDRLKRWRAKISNPETFFIRGYTGLGLAFPRPLCHTHQRDWREYFKYCAGIDSEAVSVQPDGFKPGTTEPFSTMETMDWSAIEFWVMLRLMWDPEQDVEQLYKRYCYRAYREAAKPMERFYGIIRREWIRKDVPSGISEAGSSATKRVILDAGHEDELRGLLDVALACAKHSNSKWLVERVKGRFEHYVAEVKNAKTSSLAVPLLTVKDAPTWDSEVWRNAARIDGFYDIDRTNEKAKHAAEVRVFHDTKTVYLKGRFSEDVARAPVARSATGDMFGSRWELFFGDQAEPSKYYLFRIDNSGNTSDYRCYDVKWDAKNVRISTRRLADAWESIVCLPLESIGFDIFKAQDLKCAIVREMHISDKKEDNEWTSWRWSRWHKPDTFGTLILQK